MAKTLYKNIVISLASGEDNLAVNCLRLNVDQKLAVGDKITVIGELRNHNGAIEFERGCTYEKPAAETVTDAKVFDGLKALQTDENALRGPYAVTGTIQAVEKEPSKLPQNISFYIGSLGMFFAGLLYMFMSDLTFKNPSTMLIISVLLSFGGAITFFLSMNFNEKRNIMFVLKGVGIALSIGFVIFIHVFQTSAYYLNILDEFKKMGVSGAGSLAASQATMIITLILGYIAIVGQTVNTVLVAVIKEN